jgi:hypothetical protein
MVGVKKSKKGVSYKKSSLQEICNLKEFLSDIGIKPDDYKELNDGSCILLTSNLEEEQIERLKGIGLINLGYNLFYSDSNEINVSTKFQYIKSLYTREERKIWNEIISKIIELERKCLSAGEKCPFESSILQLQICTKWHGKITTNDANFKEFVINLNSLFIESLKNNIDEQHKGHYFWQIIPRLRHGYSHDTTKWRDRDKIKIAQATREFFQDAIGKWQPNTTVGFVTCQFKILEICSDFLDSLLGEIK